MKGGIILPPKYAAEKEWAIIKYMLYNYNESESLSNSLLMLNGLLSLEDYPLQIIDNNIVPIHNVSCFSTEWGNNDFIKTDQFLFNTCVNRCPCSKSSLPPADSITDSDMEEVASSISENESMMNENQVCNGKDNPMMSESDWFCENQSKFGDFRNIDYFYDRHILKIGDDYPEVISKYIETSDLFILCWFKNAAVSDWVLQEKTYALKVASRVPSRLKIYPLSIQPLAELPDDMKEKYNFGELK
jgi:hypothetical protein